MLFQFVHATDLHYESGQNPEFPEANARVNALIDDINTMHEKSPVSFALLSGDITNCGSARVQDFVEGKACLDRLKMPYYIVAGNHDLAPHRGFAAQYPGKEDYHEGDIATSFYAKVFGSENLRFSFNSNGYSFIGVSLRDVDPEGMLDWLQGELEKAHGRTIVTTHFGVYPPREAGPLHTWGFARIGTILPRLRDIVNGYDGKVVAYLHGHDHINSAINVNGICHISSGGIQNGCTGYRLFQCYQDRIECSFRLLSDESVVNLCGWCDENSLEYTDASHQTATEYHLGTPEELDFTINFSDGVGCKGSVPSFFMDSDDDPVCV